MQSVLALLKGRRDSLAIVVPQVLLDQEQR
jgi:hypothetical protein